MSRMQLYYIILTSDFHRPQISRWFDLFHITTNRPNRNTTLIPLEEETAHNG